ncbi:MAG: lysophospholipid acyltransferase family protein [Pirellulaceae bacterium]
MGANSTNSDPSNREDAPRFSRQLLAFSLCGLIRLLSFTFLRVNHFYGACVGYVLYAFARDTKHVARTNLEIAFPKKDGQQREAILKSSLRELGKTITELGPIWCGSKKRVTSLIAGIHGQHYVDEAQERGRGVIVLVPHFGAWELAGLHLSINFNIVSLYRPPRLSGIADFVRKARERFGANLVPTNISGVRALRSSLKNNNMVGILPDQDPGEDGSVRAPFFGHSARTMVLVSRLAAKSKCAVVFLGVERLPQGQGYQLHYLPADPAIASSDELVAAAALNKGVEDIIKIAPTQYLWSYKRFRGRVAGKIDPYKEAHQNKSIRRAA